MQEDSSPLPPVISFGEFISALIRGLGEGGIRPVILRNYEGFPAVNDGSDVDFLILRSSLSRAIAVLRSVPGIRIIGFAERYYVAHLFVEGVSVAPEVRALAVDFIWNLNWKGQTYLPTESLLQAAIPRRAGDLSFFVPAPVHEAITSLSGSLLSGGVVKEKYFPEVQRTFTRNKKETIAVLRKQFGLKATNRLVEAVIAGDRKQVEACATSLRASLVLRSLLRRPFSGLIAIARYHSREFAVRFLPETIETVRIVELAAFDKAAIIEELVIRLKYSAKAVESRQFGHALCGGRESSRGGARTFSQAGAPGVSSVSVTGIARWLVEEWLSQFRKRGNLTLRILDSSCFDMLLRSGKKEDGIAEWPSRVIARMLPSSDLWILLGPACKDLPSSDEKAAFAEAGLRRELNLTLPNMKGKQFVLDCSRPFRQAAESAYAAIIDTLAQRADKRLKRSFQSYSGHLS